MVGKLRKCLVATLAIAGGSTLAWFSNAWGHTFHDRPGECHKHGSGGSHCGSASGGHSSNAGCGYCGVCPGGEDILHFWIPHGPGHAIAHTGWGANHFALVGCCSANICPTPPG